MNPIIIALDVETAADARQIADSLGDSVNFYKIGLELYASAGMDFVREMKSRGNRVFLDLKLYDIGETVKRAVARIANVGVDLLTVHAMRQVMQSAITGRDDANLKLLGVTVLTSVDDHDLAEDGYSCTAADLVERRVRNIVADNIDGVVCSAMEVSKVRALAPRQILVTPGVRSPGADTQDQKRVATPAQAIQDGADYLVIGRQVTRSKDPRAEVHKILDEIGAVSLR